MTPQFKGVPRCVHCGERATLSTTHAEGMRQNAGKKFVWACRPCGAVVGCHQTEPCGWVPLGRPADGRVRSMRRKVHELFDPIWKFGGTSRTGAYEWLARRMRIPPSTCHIGAFDARQCREAIDHLHLRFGDPVEGIFDDLVDS